MNDAVDRIKLGGMKEAQKEDFQGVLWEMKQQ